MSETTVLVFRLVPDSRDEYLRRHDEMPPEVVAALQACGITDSRLYLHGTTVVSLTTYAHSRAESERLLEDTPQVRQWIYGFDSLVIGRGLHSNEPEPLAELFWLLPNP